MYVPGPRIRTRLTQGRLKAKFRERAPIQLYDLDWEETISDHDPQFLNYLNNMDLERMSTLSGRMTNHLICVAIQAGTVFRLLSA